MTLRCLSGILTSLSALALVSAPLQASADEFIGFGQAGVPGGWALEAFPVFQHTSPNSNTIYSSFNPAYFTETGFTGTHRDQFEFWLNGSVGYSNTHGAPGGSGFGGAYPNLGIEYYYNVLVPDQPPGSPGYKTFWTSPTFTIAFPNGSSKTAGFGAGANQYSFGFNVNNYLQIGRWGITFNPIELNYATRNLNETAIADGQMVKFKGGLSATFMDVAGGYQVRDDLFLGLHHAYSIYSWKGSDFPEMREGKIGPSFTYFGFAKYGLYVSGNVNFDYYTSSNLKKSVSVTMAIVKNL
ncbi:hypothetical protein R70006_04790 [Paraburkholderia domus]|uniref:hypothetical protein n=1 Tax=Paraburkholderia domus TaxID=2793075 RepID=UPI0019128D34|nr:hypothetical protein [Paraburkholderia domus]MBK5051676.1 hypothetical protein [Burkholderia sp. R-70006]MCI0151646.1 hypothetical protein [Paraburkholderia sediminicola]CAE6789747.1 hypothetical protein R70006_04790 [Paraburkholderia domus]CAE6793757.1 hypothetical protein R75483_05012 [Paraburkholderia domus]